MKTYNYIIIGGGIAGITAAETIRERDNEGSIAIISNEPHVLYSRVLLPSYLKKRITREQVFLRKLEDFNKKNIDVYFGEEAVYVDAAAKKIGISSRIEFAYGKLLIASGGKVKPWGNLSDAYRLQTLDDADRLHTALEKIKKPLVVGSSFIALEFLEIFSINKISAAVLSSKPYFFSDKIDAAGGELLQKYIGKHGVSMNFSDALVEVSPADTGWYEAYTQNGRRLECDSFAVGIGLERNLRFLENSGVETASHGVKTNEYLETTAPYVFAAGDVAYFYDIILEKHRIVGNWTNAFLQGKMAGVNMSGGREQFRTVSGYSLTNFGLQITALGECDNSLDAEARIDQRHGHYERFFFKKGVIVGAFLINRFPDKPYVSKLIEAKKDLSAWRESLKSFSFDIHSISI